MGTKLKRMSFRQYEVIGRHVPTERDPAPKAYRIKLFTKNETQARSRFWYFIRRLVKMKKANAEILSIREIFEKKPEKVQVRPLASVRLPLRYHQHVQGVHRPVPERGCADDVPGDGRSPPCSFQLHPHHQGC